MDNGVRSIDKVLTKTARVAGRFLLLFYESAVNTRHLSITQL